MSDNEAHKTPPSLVEFIKHAWKPLQPAKYAFLIGFCDHFDAFASKSKTG